MPRVSDEDLNGNRMWLLDQLLKDEMPTIPDHRTHDLLEVIAGFIDLRKAAREAVKWADEQLCFSNWHDYQDDPTKAFECSDCKERKEIFDKLRAATGEKEDPK